MRQQRVVLTLLLVIIITVAALVAVSVLNGGHALSSTTTNQSFACPTAAPASPNYISNSTGAWNGALSDGGGCPGKALKISLGGIAQQLLVPPLASNCLAPGLGHYGALIQPGLNLSLWARLMDRPLNAPGGVSLTITRELPNGTVQRGTVFWVLAGAAPENETGHWNYAVPLVSQSGGWAPHMFDVGTRLLASAGSGWCVSQLTLVAGGGDSWFAAVYLGPKEI
jgi:hypothetical protein